MRALIFGPPFRLSPVSTRLAVATSAPPLKPFAAFPQWRALPGLGSRRLELRRDADTRIDNDAIVRPRDHGVQVEFGDVRQLVDETTDAKEQICHGPGVGRGGSTKTAEQQGDLSDLDELVRVRVGERREAKGRGSDQLRERAARSQCDKRAEDWIL